jgi:hypothetical protein
VYDTSGDAMMCQFMAPEAQTSDTLTVYVFCDAVTGSPTDVRAAVYNANTSGDPDRPELGGSPLETTGAVDFSSAAGSWVVFTFSSLSLVEGNTYFLVVDNRTGTPASNYPVIVYRPGLDTPAGLTTLPRMFGTGFTANGFTSDPTRSNALGSCVVKLSSGALIGNPYVDNVVNSPWATSNDRGNRFTPSEDMVVSGAVIGANNSSAANFEISKADGTNVITQVMPWVSRQQSRGVVRFAPLTLIGGTTYDFVITYDPSNAFGQGYYMGEASPPADVLACRGPGVAMVYGNTPGSYTVDEKRAFAMGLLVDDFPAIAGGGGGVDSILGGGQLTGGFS